MPESLLKNEFFILLESSKSFKLLPPERQTVIKNSFANATDEQFTKGIEALKKDQEETRAIEEKVKQAEVDQIRIAKEIKETMRQIKVTERKKNEAKDQADSEKMAEELLSILGVDEKKEPPKRKKFLGLF